MGIQQDNSQRKATPEMADKMFKEVSRARGEGAKMLRDKLSANADKTTVNRLDKIIGESVA